MKLRPRGDTGELLHRYYKKWVKSFVNAIYKAGITAGNKDIHEARVFLKKIFALLSFFEILEASGFSHGKYIKLFRDIFSEAGNVREIQVNILLVKRYRKEHPCGTDEFLKHLEKELKKAVKAFTAAIVGFPVNDLRRFERTVRSYCRRLDPETIAVKSQEFLLSGALKIGYLADHAHGEADIHRIRKELKKMKAVTTLLFQIESGRHLRNLIRKLEKAEIMIGEWHDLVVLDAYIKNFRQKTASAAGSGATSLQSMKDAVRKEASVKLILAMPLISEINGHFYHSD